MGGLPSRPSNEPCPDRSRPLSLCAGARRCQDFPRYCHRGPSLNPIRRYGSGVASSSLDALNELSTWARLSPPFSFENSFYLIRAIKSPRRPFCRAITFTIFRASANRRSNRLTSETAHPLPRAILRRRLPLMIEAFRLSSIVIEPRIASNRRSSPSSISEDSPDSLAPAPGKKLVSSLRGPCHALCFSP